MHDVFRYLGEVLRSSQQLFDSGGGLQGRGDDRGQIDSHTGVETVLQAGRLSAEQEADTGEPGFLGDLHRVRDIRRMDACLILGSDAHRIVLADLWNGDASGPLGHLIAHKQQQGVLFLFFLGKPPPVFDTVLFDEFRPVGADLKHMNQRRGSRFGTVTTPAVGDDPWAAPLKIDALVLVVADGKLESGFQCGGDERVDDNAFPAVGCGGDHDSRAGLPVE